MDFLTYLLYSPCFCIPFLILFTKLHDGSVTIGDLILDTIIGVLPFVNVIGSVYLLCQTFGRRNWLDKKVF
jgi:hypothetical protein